MMRLQVPFPRSLDKHQNEGKKVKGDATNISGITDKGVSTQFTYYWHGTIKEYHERKNVPNARNKFWIHSGTKDNNFIAPHRTN